MKKERNVMKPTLEVFNSVMVSFLLGLATTWILNSLCLPVCLSIL